jgi:hypothetical protein
MPQNAAGCRIDPPVSVPRLSGTQPDATQAAAPPLLPPGVRVMSHGFRVTPKKLVSVLAPIANSSMLVLPMTIASADRNFETTVASYGGWKSRSILEEQVVGMPRVHRTSLTAIGMPASGPRVSPRRRRPSTSFAARIASASAICVNARTLSWLL